MKVKELIERLQALDPELEVMHYGSHEVVYKDDKHPGHKIIKAVRIY